jgi:amino acid permease
MSFGIYLVGYIILIAGLAIGANILNVPLQWIAVGILCLIGMAIVHGVTATRQKDPQSSWFSLCYLK